MKGTVGGAAGVIYEADSATTDCQPNENVEALRVALDKAMMQGQCGNRCTNSLFIRAGLR